MSDKFQEYRERAQKRALTVYGCFRVNLSGVSKGGRVLVLTEQFAALYTTSKKPSETVYEWIDAKSYNWEDETITMQFDMEDDGELAFECEEAPQVHEKIVRILEGMFSPDELAPFKLSKYPHTPRPAGGAACIGRFNARMKEAGKSGGDASFWTELRELIFCKLRSFDTGRFEGWEADASELYDVLSVLPHLESLTVRRQSKKADIYGVLAKYIGKFQTLRHLEISEPPAKRFDRFIEGVKKTHLTGLTIGFELNEETIQKIAEAVKAVGMTSIRFDQPFGKAKLMRNLLDDLLVPCSATLQMVTLSRVRVDVKELAKMCPNLSVLGLVSCRLNIDQAINDLGTMQNLRVLSLKSNNGVFESVPENVPPCLVRLDLSKIEWNRTSFKNVISFVCSRRWPMGIELSLAQASIEGEDSLDGIWEALDSIKSQLPISAFSWDRTEPSLSLFNFLMKAPKLQTLSLHGVFSDKHEEIIRRFAQVIPHMAGLRNLNVSGSRSVHCGEALIPLIQALTSASFVEALDVSHQRIGNKGISALTEFVNSKSGITSLAYDDTGANDWSAWNGLIQAAEAKGRPWLFLYPLRGMFEYVKAGQLSKDEAPVVKRRILNVMGGWCPDDENPYEIMTESRIDCSMPDFIDVQIERLLRIGLQQGGDQPSQVQDKENRKQKGKDKNEDSDSDAKPTDKRKRMGSTADKEKKLSSTSDEKPKAVSKGSRRQVSSDSEEAPKNADSPAKKPSPSITGGTKRQPPRKRSSSSEEAAATADEKPKAVSKKSHRQVSSDSEEAPKNADSSAKKPSLSITGGTKPQPPRKRSSSSEEVAPKAANDIKEKLSSSSANPKPSPVKSPKELSSSADETGYPGIKATQAKKEKKAVLSSSSEETPTSKRAKDAKQPAASLRDVASKSQNRKMSDSSSSDKPQLVQKLKPQESSDSTEGNSKKERNQEKKPSPKKAGMRESGSAKKKEQPPDSSSSDSEIDRKSKQASMSKSPVSKKKALLMSSSDEDTSSSVPAPSAKQVNDKLTPKPRTSDRSAAQRVAQMTPPKRNSGSVKLQIGELGYDEPKWDEFPLP